MRGVVKEGKGGEMMGERLEFMHSQISGVRRREGASRERVLGSSREKAGTCVQSAYMPGGTSRRPLHHTTTSTHTKAVIIRCCCRVRSGRAHASAPFQSAATPSRVLCPPRARRQLPRLCASMEAVLQLMEAAVQLLMVMGLHSTAGWVISRWMQAARLVLREGRGVRSRHPPMQACLQAA